MDTAAAIESLSEKYGSFYLYDEDAFEIRPLKPSEGLERVTVAGNLWRT